MHVCGLSRHYRARNKCKWSLACVRLVERDRQNMECGSSECPQVVSLLARATQGCSYKRRWSASTSYIFEFDFERLGCSFWERSGDITWNFRGCRSPGAKCRRPACIVRVDG